MSFSYAYTETVDGVAHPHSIVYDDVSDAAMMGKKQAVATMEAVALASALSGPIPPSYVPPDRFATMPDGSILTVGTDGSVYLDGGRLGAAKVSKLVRFGKSVYGLGLTSPLWWQWTGSTWVQVTTFDSSILK